jgi:transcriptional regulatory protein RtcR
MTADNGFLTMILGDEAAGNLDLFDKVQLGEVLRVCRASRNLSDAGRSLFRVTRQGKKTANDADRLRKYLARFNIQWDDIRGKSDSQF